MFGWIPVFILILAQGSAAIDAEPSSIHAWHQAVSRSQEPTFAQVCRLIVQPGQRIDKGQLLQLHDLLSQDDEEFDAIELETQPAEADTGSRLPFAVLMEAAPTRAGP